MYAQVETDEQFQLKAGVGMIPVATLADEHGGRLQIAVDDHCYVLYLKQPSGNYQSTSYIFREAFEVLRKMEPPE